MEKRQQHGQNKMIKIFKFGLLSLHLKDLNVTQWKVRAIWHIAVLPYNWHIFSQKDLNHPNYVFKVF